MYSSLVFEIGNNKIEFTASELIHIAHEITQEAQATLEDNEVELPNHHGIDEKMERAFQRLILEFAQKVAKGYQVDEKETCLFLFNIYFDPTSVLNYSDLLSKLQDTPKTQPIGIQIAQHISIPISLANMSTLKQWLFIAKYLAANYLKAEYLAGWWFRIGGRVIRLRNDVIHGELTQSNKQFYASDHGMEAKIIATMPGEIQRCLNNFSWGPNGSWFGAYKFWTYFNLFNLKKLKIKFVERISEANLNNHQECCQLIASLEQAECEPLPIAARISISPNLSRQQVEKHSKIFERVLEKVINQNIVSGYGFSIDLDKKAWIKIKFINELTEAIVNSESECLKLFEDCYYSAYFPDVQVPYSRLSEEVKRKREKKFERIVRSSLAEHQRCLKEEFIARLTEEITASPSQCQILLISLAHSSPKVRGTLDINTWPEVNSWRTGSRNRLTHPENSAKALSKETRVRYERIFDDLIEQFRYITEGVVTQYAYFMKEESIFHTQIRNITDTKTAEDFILTHALYELAKKINYGKHEPLFRELNAYGDSIAGNSYHKFEESFLNYFQKKDALSEAALASLMRAILAGKSVESEDLSFLPCLTAAWFVSEAARNRLTTMTSLMLLDMIESQVVLPAPGGGNWYCWPNALIHPLKSSNNAEVKDLNGKKMNIDAFGGCHPMVHQGSVIETNSVLVTTPLPPARQKEGSLIIHWLQFRIEQLKETKDEYGFQSVNAQATCDNKQKTNSLEQLCSEEEKIEKQSKKLQATIRYKRDKNPEANVSKEEAKIKELSIEMAKIVRLKETEIIKKQLRKNIIEPLLRERLTRLDNLLKLDSDYGKRQESYFKFFASPSTLISTVTAFNKKGGQKLTS